MLNKKIAILGGGNLGLSIAEGLIKSKLFKPDDISITKRKIQQIEYLQKEKILITQDNIRAVSDSEIIVIAVKPKQLNHRLKEIKSTLNPAKHLFISSVTGVDLKEIQSVIGSEITLFRVMPNTAISIQESMTCISTNNANEKQTQFVISIFNQLGKSIIIEDELMGSATVLGACGIAYSMRFIRAASQGGIEIGFDSDVAQLIAAQTVKGAASLLLATGRHPEEEIDKVTTPQGCTIAGLNEMEHQGFSSALIRGVITSYKKVLKITE